MCTIPAEAKKATKERAINVGRANILCVFIYSAAIGEPEWMKLVSAQ